MRNLRWTLPPACCKVGLDRPLIPTAFIANLFRSARVSRPRRSAFGSARVSRPRRLADRGSPGDAPTVGDGGRRGRAGQETVPEPARRRQPQVTALGQSDHLPRTPHGQGTVRRQRFGVDPPGLGRVGDECSFPAWGLRHHAKTCRPIRVLVARARSESSKGLGDEAAEDFLRDQ
jgi:hypothetical protein